MPKFLIFPRLNTGRIECDVISGPRLQQIESSQNWMHPEYQTTFPVKLKHVDRKDLSIFWRKGASTKLNVRFLEFEITTGAGYAVVRVKRGTFRDRLGRLRRFSGEYYPDRETGSFAIVPES